MTSKEKAKELIGKFYVNIPLRDCDNRRPHKLALIAVDELLKNCYEVMKPFWEEVKQEIEKL